MSFPTRFTICAEPVRPAFAAGFFRDDDRVFRALAGATADAVLGPVFGIFRGSLVSVLSSRSFAAVEGLVVRASRVVLVETIMKVR